MTQKRLPMTHKLFKQYFLYLMLIHLLLSKLFVIKDTKYAKYIYAPFNGELQLTPNLSEATDFEILKTERPIELLLRNKNTSRVLDNPGNWGKKRVYLAIQHTHPNQRWTFIMDESGGFTIVQLGQRLVFDPIQNYFFMKMGMNKEKNETSFIFMDRNDSTPYSNSMENVPVQADRMRIEENSVPLLDPEEGDLRTKLFGSTFGPQTHKDRLMCMAEHKTKRPSRFRRWLNSARRRVFH